MAGMPFDLQLLNTLRGAAAAALLRDALAAARRDAREPARDAGRAAAGRDAAARVAHGPDIISTCRRRSRSRSR